MERINLANDTQSNYDCPIQDFASSKENGKFVNMNWVDYAAEKETRDITKVSDLQPLSELEMTFMDRNQELEFMAKKQLMIQVADAFVRDFSELKRNHEEQKSKIKSLHSQHIEDVKKIEELEMELCRVNCELKDHQNGFMSYFIYLIMMSILFIVCAYLLGLSK